MQVLVMTTITTMMSMSNHLGIMTNNMGTVVNLLMCLLTVSGDDFLTLLNVCGVHNLLTDLLGDLARVLLRVLVALLVLLVFTVRSGRVSMASSISITLVVSTIAVARMVNTNNLRVMANNMGAVVNLLVFLLTMSSDNIFTFFNIGDIHNNIILYMALIMLRLLGNLVALVVLLVMAVRTTGVAMASMASCTKDSRGREEEN